VAAATIQTVVFGCLGACSAMMRVLLTCQSRGATPMIYGLNHTVLQRCCLIWHEDEVEQHRTQSAIDFAAYIGERTE